MVLKMFDRAILTVDIPSENFSAGDVGTIVDEHVVPGVSETGNSGECFDMTGRTVAVVTVRASGLREPTPADRPSVRVLSEAE